MTLLIIYLSVALGFSFLCSIAEAVLLSVSPAYINLLEQSGNKSGKILRALKADVDTTLASILSLNTIAHTVGAAGVGAQASIVFGDASLGMVSAVLTLLILVFSEIIPKTLGTYQWRKLAPSMAYVMKALVVMMKAVGLVALSKGITKLIGGGEHLAGFSRSEFAAMAEIGEEEGQLDSAESQILKNLIALKEQKVRDIMTPRPVIFSIEEKWTVQDFIDQAGESPFSRIPVFKDNADNITGFVLRSELLSAHIAGRTGKRVGRFQRDLRAIPHTLDVFSAFKQCLEHDDHIMLVVDEYGGVRGILSLEDILETLIGSEIVDERDHAQDMQAVAKALWQSRQSKKTSD